SWRNFGTPGSNAKRKRRRCGRPRRRCAKRKRHAKRAETRFPASALASPVEGKGLAREPERAPEPEQVRAPEQEQVLVRVRVRARGQEQLRAPERARPLKLDLA